MSSLLWIFAAPLMVWMAGTVAANFINPHVQHEDKTPCHSVAASRAEAPADERKTL